MWPGLHTHTHTTGEGKCDQGYTHTHLMRVNVTRATHTHTPDEGKCDQGHTQTHTDTHTHTHTPPHTHTHTHTHPPPHTHTHLMGVNVCTCACFRFLLYHCTYTYIVCLPHVPGAGGAVNYYNHIFLCYTNTALYYVHMHTCPHCSLFCGTHVLWTSCGLFSCAGVRWCPHTSPGTLHRVPVYVSPVSILKDVVAVVFTNICDDVHNESMYRPIVL